MGAIRLSLPRLSRLLLLDAYRLYALLEILVLLLQLFSLAIEFALDDPARFACHLLRQTSAQIVEGRIADAITIREDPREGAAYQTE